MYCLSSGGGEGGGTEVAPLTWLWSTHTHTPINYADLETVWSYRCPLTHLNEWTKYIDWMIRNHRHSIPNTIPNTWPSIEQKSRKFENCCCRLFVCVSMKPSCLSMQPTFQSIVGQTNMHGTDLLTCSQTPPSGDCQQDCSIWEQQRSEWEIISMTTPYINRLHQNNNGANVEVHPSAAIHTR